MDKAPLGVWDIGEWNPVGNPKLWHFWRVLSISTDYPSDNSSQTRNPCAKVGRFLILGNNLPGHPFLVWLYSSLYFSLFCYFGFGYGLSALHEAWENSRRFAEQPTVSSSSEEIPYWWHVTTLRMEFLRSSFSPHFARKASWWRRKMSAFFWG